MARAVKLVVIAIAVLLCVVPGVKAEYIQDGGSIALEAVPPTLNILLDNPLTIQCRYKQNPNFVQTVLHSLTLSKRGYIYGAFDIISELTVSNPNSPTRPANANEIGISNVNGTLSKDRGTSSLSVTWNGPSRSEAGTYACTVKTYEKDGTFQSLHEEVLVKDGSLEFLYSKLKVMQVRLDSMLNQPLPSPASGGSNKLIPADDGATGNGRQYLMSSEYKGRVYLLSLFQAKGFHMANAFCQLKGGYLAELQNSDEFKYIKSFITVNGQSKPNSVLLGGTDEEKEGEWYWSHSGTPMSFIPWGRGEPNNLNNENCITLFRMLDYALNDSNCHLSTPFLCEIPIDGGS